MPSATINYLAVLVCGIVYMVIGMIWYSNFLFGKVWRKLTGMKDGSMGNSKSMAKTYGLSFAMSLIMAYVLAHFVDYVGVTTVNGGMQLGFWVWLGFVATMGANRFIYNTHNLSWKLYFIDMGYLLVSLLAFGAILAGWA